MSIEELSKELLKFNQDALYVCLSCGNTYPVKDNTGLICPECERTPEEKDCKDLIDLIPEMIEMKAAMAAEEPEEEVEIEEEAERSDPPGLDDVIGNAAAVRQIRLALDAYRNRLKKAEEGKKPIFPHTFWSGPGGTGKTMMSEIIAREIGLPLRLQMGQSLTNPTRVGEILLDLKAGDILFIDEIHGLKVPCQETLYRAMEDSLYVPVCRGGDVTDPIKLPPFTLIGSTTDEWNLLPSLLQRFKYRIRMQRLEPSDLAIAITQRAERKGWSLDKESSIMIGNRAHGTPRLAVGLLDGCMDTAVADDHEDITLDVVKKTCEIWGLDDLGLDEVTRKYMKILADSKDEPVKLNVLAMKLDGLSRRTVEIRIEPDLVWMGLVKKGKKGRSITEKGMNHIMKGKYLCQNQLQPK